MVKAMSSVVAHICAECDTEFDKPISEEGCPICAHSDALYDSGFAIDQETAEHVDFSREKRVEIGEQTDLFLVHRVTFEKESGLFYGTAIESDDYHENSLGESPKGDLTSVLAWLRNTRRGSDFSNA